MKSLVLLLATLVNCCIAQQLFDQQLFDIENDTQREFKISKLAEDIIANPNLLISQLQIANYPEVWRQLFTLLNKGKTPQWIIDNTKSHESLVSQQYPKSRYDFIIVGAGTAGSIVASRLSENPKIRVLLLEAGGPESIVNDMPFAFFLSPNSKYDWAFRTEPQNNSFINMEGQRCRWQRGRIMGGSSAINAMVYVRGNYKDYDNWASITGDDSWSYAKVFKYFLKSEHNYDREMLSNGYHNGSGLYPVTSNWKTDRNPTERKVIEAALEFGIKQIDANADQQTGVNVAQQAILNGNRVTASKAFLESVKPNRPNLDIIANAFVKHIIFSKDKRAIGVVYDRFDRTFQVFADLEVILCAGSIKSPHILLTSGVGPKHQLRNFNIPVIADLPGVGENLQDHVNTMGISYTIPSLDTVWPISYSSFAQYAESREGPLSYLNDLEMPLSSTINDDKEWPDMQFNVISVPPGIDPIGLVFNQMFGLSFEVFKRMYSSHFLEPAFMTWSDVTRPKSRGNLELKSSDPYVYPLLQPNYFSHPNDIKVLIEGNQWLYRFEYTKTFQKWGAKIFPEKVVGCESKWSLVRDKQYPHILVPNDDYLECHARHMTRTEWHFVGTVKMGKASDPMAVVDTQLNVLGGITNLRVIDSSIMPVITDGNTNAPTMMIAEKGSQMIKDKYNL